MFEFIFSFSLGLLSRDVIGINPATQLVVQTFHQRSCPGREEDKRRAVWRLLSQQVARQTSSGLLSQAWRKTVGGEDSLSSALSLSLSLSLFSLSLSLHPLSLPPFLSLPSLLSIYLYLSISFSLFHVYHVYANKMHDLISIRNSRSGIFILMEHVTTFSRKLCEI